MAENEDRKPLMSSSLVPVKREPTTEEEMDQLVPAPPRLISGLPPPSFGGGPLPSRQDGPTTAVFQQRVVEHHHHYGAGPKHKHGKRSPSPAGSDQEDSPAPRVEVHVHRPIDPAEALRLEMEQYPPGSFYANPCLHCDQKVQRQYAPHPKAAGTFYLVCANPCGQLVLHTKCADAIANDWSADKDYVCELCGGEIHVSPALAVFLTIYNFLTGIQWRKWITYALYWILLGYLLKLWWFGSIVVGYERIDYDHNPALIGQKRLGLFDFFRYNYTMMDKLNPTVFGKFGKWTTGEQFDPIAYQSRGWRCDAGQFWMTARAVMFVAFTYYAAYYLGLRRIALKARGAFTHANITVKHGAGRPKPAHSVGGSRHRNAKR